MLTMVGKYVLDTTFEEMLRERYDPSLEVEIRDQLHDYGRRILDIDEPQGREILLDHLEGLYKMASGEEENDGLDEAAGFLDNVLGQIETGKIVDEVARQHLAKGRPTIRN